MEGEFQKRTVLCYSNFMKYIISFSLFNVFLLIIENGSIIYLVDIMLDGNNILKELFTPFYFLSPHLYLEILNEKLPNQCFQIFDFNLTIEKYEGSQNYNNNDTNILRYLKEKKKNFRKKREKFRLKKLIQRQKKIKKKKKRKKRKKRKKKRKMRIKILFYQCIKE